MEGKVTLPVTSGAEKGSKATHMVEFLVVDKESPYNAIIGSPMLNKIRANAYWKGTKRYAACATSKGRMKPALEGVIAAVNHKHP